MSSTQTVTENTLTLEIVDEPSEVLVRWKGKSSDRDPGTFLAPLFARVLAQVGARALVLDFSQLDYMNSSTFTPLVKLLGEANRGTQKLRLEYSRDRKWQTLSFSALRAFETADGRISLLPK